MTSHRSHSTRSQLQATLAVSAKEEWLCMDTPGFIKKTDGYAFEALQQATHTGIADAHIILFVTEKLVWNEKDEDLFRFIRQTFLQEGSKPLFWIINKIDAVYPKTRLLSYIQETRQLHDDIGMVFLVSARKKSGMEDLKKEILKIDCAPVNSTAQLSSDISRPNDETLFRIRELVRQQIYHFYHAEIPYVTKIDIERITERAWRICLTVPKSNQKKIILGTRGMLLKKIQAHVQKKLESLLPKNCRLFWHVQQDHASHPSREEPPVIRMLTP